MVFADVNINDIISSNMEKIFYLSLDGLVKLNNYKTSNDIKEIICLDNFCGNVSKEFGKYKDYLIESSQIVIDKLETIHEGLDYFINNKKEENTLVLIESGLQNLITYMEDNVPELK